MPRRCLECGAPLPAGGNCRDHFHALLAQEWQIPGGPGALPHFFAVAAYGLQHPSTMEYTRETVAGLRSAVADALAGNVSLAELRQQARAGAERQGRVTRREGEPEVRWSISEWPTTVVDVLPTMTDQSRYAQHVSKWARSTVEMLDLHHPTALYPEVEVD